MQTKTSYTHCWAGRDSGVGVLLNQMEQGRNYWSGTMDITSPSLARGPGPLRARAGCSGCSQTHLSHRTRSGAHRAMQEGRGCRGRETSFPCFCQKSPRFLAKGSWWQTGLRIKVGMCYVAWSFSAKFSKNSGMAGRMKATGQMREI